MRFLVESNRQSAFGQIAFRLSLECSDEADSQCRSAHRTFAHRADWNRDFEHTLGANLASKNNCRSHFQGVDSQHCMRRHNWVSDVSDLAIRNRTLDLDFAGGVVCYRCSAAVAHSPQPKCAVAESRLMV